MKFNLLSQMSCKWLFGRNLKLWLCHTCNLLMTHSDFLSSVATSLLRRSHLNPWHAHGTVDGLIIIFTWLRPKKVSMARTGAARAKTRRCLRMRFLSRPACIRKDTRPNAAGAWERHSNKSSHRFTVTASDQICRLLLLSSITWSIKCLKIVKVTLFCQIESQK